jgi:RNA polymerase sigma factor (sigma-70 family)
MDTDGVSVLVQKARAGDPEAWNELFARVRPFLLNCAARLLLPAWPGESVSLVLGLVWERGRKGIRHFRGGASDADTARILKAWLRQVVRSAIDTGVVRPAVHGPRGQPVAHTDPGSSAPAGAIVPVDGLPSALTELIDAEQLTRLRHALAGLAEQDRELIRLRFEEQRSVREVARLLRRDESTLRYHYANIFAALRQALEKTS